VSIYANPKFEPKTHTANRQVHANNLATPHTLRYCVYYLHLLQFGALLTIYFRCSKKLLVLLPFPPTYCSLIYNRTEKCHDMAQIRITFNKAGYTSTTALLIIIYLNNFLNRILGKRKTISQNCLRQYTNMTKIVA
jgi:hypothetical protein